MSFMLHRAPCFALALVILLGSATPAAAQTTFTACRIPDVGAIYMIGLTGLPTECLDPAHVEFSWTEGGTVADGGVTTAKLADGAVTTAKLAAGAVTGAALADGAVTQSTIAADAVDSLSILDGSILGADLRAGTVGSSQIGDGSVTGTDVGVGTLEPVNFAPGAVGAIVQTNVGNTGTLSTTPTAIGEVSYAAPAEGVVLILVTGSAYLTGEDTRVRIGIGTTAGSTSMQEVSMGYTNGTGTADFFVPFSTIGAAQIAVGGISRYYASAWLDAGDDTYTASLVDVKMELIYVPNGG